MDALHRGRELPISVVIATLGGGMLRATVEQLNQGEYFPAEILICTPTTEAVNVGCIADIANVHVIETPCRGQVAQRAIGLGVATCPFVMQFDDDVILPADTLGVLYKILIEKGPGNVIAPFFRRQISGEDGTKLIRGWFGLLHACYATLVCGAKFGKDRFGTISSSGIGFGVTMSFGDPRVIESEWLPGGVVLCHKTDLIIHNYYPFQGKAFSEDLIHSILWRQQGCRLWTALDVSAMIDVTVESYVWKSVMGRYRAHAYVARMLGGSVWRTRLWLFLHCVIHVHQFLRQNFQIR